MYALCDARTSPARCDGSFESVRSDLAIVFEKPSVLDETSITITSPFAAAKRSGDSRRPAAPPGRAPPRRRAPSAPARPEPPASGERWARARACRRSESPAAPHGGGDRCGGDRGRPSASHRAVQSRPHLLREMRQRLGPGRVLPPCERPRSHLERRRGHLAQTRRELVERPPSLALVVAPCGRLDPHERALERGETPPAPASNATTTARAPSARAALPRSRAPPRPRGTAPAAAPASARTAGRAAARCRRSRCGPSRREEAERRAEAAPRGRAHACVSPVLAVGHGERREANDAGSALRRQTGAREALEARSWCEEARRRPGVIRSTLVVTTRYGLKSVADAHRAQPGRCARSCRRRSRPRQDRRTARRSSRATA